MLVGLTNQCNLLSERPRGRPQRAVSYLDGALPLSQRDLQNLRWRGRCCSGGRSGAGGAGAVVADVLAQAARASRMILK
jgi:hypothetical protein